MMDSLKNDLGTALLVTGAANNASGGILDARGAGDFGILMVRSTANSAIWDFQYSPDGVNFGTGLTVTAAANTTGFYQISAYYPYVKFALRLVYSAAGGSAQVHAYYRPGYSR